MTFPHRWRAVAGLVAIAACMPPSPAHQGALVGLTSGRTLWIAWPNDSARVVTEKPHLLVPRGDGMWWAGVVTRCVVEVNDAGWVEDSIFIGRTDRVFVTRAGEEARVDLDGTTCDEAEREVLDLRTRARKSARRDTAAPEEEPLNPETFYCSIYSRRITFASPTVLSIEARDIGTEFCSPAKYSTSGTNIVREFTSHTRVPLRPLLPADVTAQLDSLFVDSDGSGFFDDPAANIDSSWGIRRQQGAWSARIWVDGPVVARGGHETEEGPLLPQSFTGYTPLPISWNELVRQVPESGDAIASPTDEYILVQKRDSLLLFRLTNGQLGSPLLSVHIGYYEELAMVRWATTDETRRWNATLPTLEPPKVRVVSSP
jgi:hypothetical protein